jgi:hypothetical protein
MTLEEAKALIARVDAADAAGDQEGPGEAQEKWHVRRRRRRTEETELKISGTVKRPTENTVMTVEVEGTKIILHKDGGKTDIGLPIQPVLDSMHDLQAKVVEHRVYAWSEDRVWVWTEAGGWTESRRLPDVLEAPCAKLTIEEARALIARVDAAEKATREAGTSLTDEFLLELGYVHMEGGCMHLPIPVEICKQLAAEQSREKGAKLLEDMCNTGDPQEVDRLARELAAHLMSEPDKHSDPVVQALIVVTDENYSEMLKRFRSLPAHSPEWEVLGNAIGKWMLG